MEQRTAGLAGGGAGFRAAGTARLLAERRSSARWPEGGARREQCGVAHRSPASSGERERVAARTGPDGLGRAPRGPGRAAATGATRVTRGNARLGGAPAGAEVAARYWPDDVAEAVDASDGGWARPLARWRCDLGFHP